MGDEFLNNCMIVYIEIEIARKFSTKFIRHVFVEQRNNKKGNSRIQKGN